jgi:acyl-CoA thioesterase II
MTTLNALLKLESLDGRRFVSGAHQANRRGSCYGGQLLGQALQAAVSTVRGKRPLAMQVSFEAAARIDAPIVYAVGPVRDGRTSATRSVIARQGDMTVLLATVSFGVAARGWEHASARDAASPSPDLLPSLEELARSVGAGVSAHAKGRLSTYPQVEVRPVDAERHFLLRSGPPESRFWIRAVGEPPLSADMHAAATAYLSDYLLANAALIPHAEALPDEPLFVASLTHSMWFHMQSDPTRWLYSQTQSPWAGEGRAFCWGHLFSEGGILIASIAQEMTIRRRRAQNDLGIPSKCSAT